ncbi:hypothetical protein [Gordonia sp. FQ]|uniref:hypothetical protein n=1 Tax=Gordonia sp. FQ TaxID=3446634 RepID=UPI003F85DD58
MSTTPNRAARRRSAQREAREGKKQIRTWRRSVAALSAAAVIGVGMAGGVGAGVATADDIPPASSGVDLGSLDIGSLLDNEMLTQFVEMCRTGSLANNPGDSQGTQWDPSNTAQGQLPPDAIATCTDSTGTGLALVLPERFEVGSLAQNYYMDLGPDQSILGLVNFKMGNQNLFNIIGGLLFDAPKVLGLVSVRDQAISQYGISIDPRMFNAYSTYDQVIADANIAPDVRTKDVCINEYGKYLGDASSLLGCTLVGGDKVSKGQDINNKRRNMARSVLEYLAADGVTYPRNSSVPIDIPPIPKAKGESIIKGDGINVALSMRGGKAVAETGNNLSVALAGADHGRLAQAYAKYGIAIAADMDLNDITFTWFGQKVDFSNLKPLLESQMAQDAGAGDMAPMLDMIDSINGNIPALKEVFCFGVNAKATAESFGSCSNFLGTFDTYQDLRPANATDLANGSMNRQESQAIMDLSSLVFGNDALLKSFLPMLSGGGDGLDLGSLLSNPAVAKILAGVLDENTRVKLTKDFIRYTKNIETTFDKEQATDSSGNLLWDKVIVKVQQKDDAGRLLYVLDGHDVIADEDGNIPAGAVPKTKDVVKQQQSKKDGALLFTDASGHEFTKAADGTWRDADGEVVGTVDTDTMNPVMEDVVTPRMKNKTAARMVGVTQDAWETYTSDEPVWLTRIKQEQAKDADGNLLWDDADKTVPTMVNAKTQATNGGKPVWIVDGSEVASWDKPSGEGITDVAPKMVDATEQVAKRDDNGQIVYQHKVRYYKKPVMIQQVDADNKPVYRDPTAADAASDVVWLDADGNKITVADGEEAPEGAVKKVPVMVQKTEQARDDQGRLIWDPVVKSTTTAYWLTSDYGLREPLVIEWLGHQIVLFPSVDLNDGTTRPNLIGAPQITRIIDDANVGLLPKINLVHWDNPLGLGTWTFDRPWDPFHTIGDFKSSITLDDDLKMLDKLLGPMLFPGSERLSWGLLEQLGLDPVKLGLKKNPAPVEPTCVPADATETSAAVVCPDDEQTDTPPPAAARLSLPVGDDDGSGGSKAGATEPGLAAAEPDAGETEPAVTVTEPESPQIDTTPSGSTGDDTSAVTPPAGDAGTADPAPEPETPAQTEPSTESDSSGDLVGAGLGE